VSFGSGCRLASGGPHGTADHERFCYLKRIGYDLSCCAETATLPTNRLSARRSRRNWRGVAMILNPCTHRKTANSAPTQNEDVSIDSTRWLGSITGVDKV
jgi:hypothetical protein